MKQLLFITLFFLSINAKSQNHIKDQIIGSWKVENSTIKSTDKNMLEMARSFKNAIFSFRENRDFIVTSKEKNRVINMLISSLNNEKWLFDERDKKFKIGTDKDHYTIMSIAVRVENNKAYFKIDEAELNLELVKI
ncbi:hypothetical protein [Flavobacterium sp. ov086]|uniref:hypothetical protein n=1 Tax=Flavobacterium sp. ov086 TaxID=1761785 RepID=UPI000B74FFB9|nr:hypothetical protein [Flavobacterium sp. ov086]SNR82790.1 hypothetical protein SAMN04487979_12392 [Flavobacterium sp. ov086]